MKNGIKAIQQIGLPSKSTKQKNKPSNKYESRLIDIDRLSLGLFCCEKNPNLINILVDYWLNWDSMYDDICFWIEKGLVEFEAYDIPDSLKGELFAMKIIFPVDELINLISRSFPDRKETPFSILLMLKKCSYYVHIALSEGDDVDYDNLDDDVDYDSSDDDVYRDRLASKTLDRIKDELLFLQSIPKNRH